MNRDNRKTKKTEPRDKSASAREIADHVAAILNHRDCPEELADEICRGIADLNDNGNVAYKVGYVEAVLLTHYEDVADREKGVE
jgi:hypothetical protein